MHYDNSNPESVVDDEYTDSQEIIPHVEVALSVERDPAVVLAEARKAALALKDVIESKKDKVVLNGKTYLTYEDWQTVGRFYGISAKVVSSTHVQYGEVSGFEARAVAILSSNGVEVSAAEAMCLNDEDKWGMRSKYEWVNGKKTKVGEIPTPLYQLKSMAQTRACAKALRNVLAFVPVLAGYQPTPAEEMLERGSSEAAAEVGEKRLAEVKSRVARQETAKKPTFRVGLDPAKVIFVLQYPKDPKGDHLISGPGLELVGAKRVSPENPNHRLIAGKDWLKFHDVCRNKGVVVKDVANPSAE
jgi:hypothetical protein